MKGWSGSILTVGVLKALIADQDDHINVLIATDDWYDNVGQVVVPANDDRDEYQCVTLFIGSEFDARQI